MSSLDCVQGTLVGVVLGDALGAPHEYCRNLAYTGKLEHSSQFFTRWQGSYTLPPGQVTDDSEMTIILARSLLQGGGYDPDKVALSYMEWANSGVRTIGTNTRGLFKGIKTLKGYKARISKILRLPLSERSQSNGSLMRCSPLSVLKDDECIEADCNLSNPHPVTIDCNRVYVNALRDCQRGLSREEIVSLALLRSQTEEVKETLQGALSEGERDVREKRGWCLHSLWCAFRAFSRFDSYSEAIGWVIRLGGDTDTNAAITGGLMGAHMGLNAMLSETETSENLKILLAADSSNGDCPRPGCYQPKDILDLGERLYLRYCSSS